MKHCKIQFQPYISTRKIAVKAKYLLKRRDDKGNTLSEIFVIVASKEKLPHGRT